MGIAWAETLSLGAWAPGRRHTKRSPVIVFGFSCVIPRRRKTGVVPAGGHDTWVTLCMSLGLLDVSTQTITAVGHGGLATRKHFKVHGRSIAHRSKRMHGELVFRSAGAKHFGWHVFSDA